MGKIQKISSLAVVIAVIVVCVDANDLTKFPTTTPKGTTAFITTENAEIKRNVANLETTNGEKTQTATLKRTTTTSTSTEAVTTKQDFLQEESSVKAIEAHDENNVVNYQNVSRVKAKKNAARDLVKNAEELVVENDGKVTGTQMNIPEMLSNQQRRHGHVNDNVVQNKLQQTNEDATTTNIPPPAAEILPTAIENVADVDNVKLAEFILNDRQSREHEIPMADIPTRTTISTTLNIADLYPLQKSDLEAITLPIVFTYKDVQTAAEYRQNLLPNEVEMTQQQPKEKNFVSQILHKRQTATNLRHDINDFTGKLLAEEDGGVITEIEQKFRIDELAATKSTKPTQHSSNLESLDAAIAKVFAAAAAKEGNATPASSSQVFLDRRVKKSYSYSFPQQKEAITTNTPKVSEEQLKQNDNNNNNNNDFAQTKFSNGSNGKTVTGISQQEFSTTKFYNSKELYNEMMNGNKNITILNNNNNNNNNSETKSMERKINQYAVLTNPKFKTFRKSKDMNLPSYVPATASVVTSSSTSRNTMPSTVKPLAHVFSVGVTKPTITTTTTTTTATTESKTAHGKVLGAEAAPTQTESNKITALERIKWRLKAILPDANSNNYNGNNFNSSHNIAFGMGTATATTKQPKTATNGGLSDGISVTGTSTTTTNGYKDNTSDNANASTSKISTKTKINAETTKTTNIKISNIKNTLATATAAMKAEISAVSMFKKIPMTTTISTTTTATTTTTTAETMAFKQHRATNPTKSSLKPISRPRTLSQLQQKINALECEIAIVATNAHLWRGNETHELLLPIMSANNCQRYNTEDCFGASIASWDGEAEIQSGDILIVEINDTLLKPHDRSNTSSAHNTQVYQVTRSGHEHCDVTEGILLDITPLVVDGRKLVTLYDKDLTEGVNLLIVVSELWGSQCVRLKVTTKTDNCGENADCSGKGVCYSSPAMEEYECQCCSGFAGPHCEEIDACTPSPCTNNGICVDLSQGHDGNSYQCLCPYGYTGKNCQYEADPCNPADCLNGGTCVGNATHFRCDCTAGYTGPLCQHSLNECESSPCVHGICVDQEDGFRCFCQPGFAGELCNFEYNECESNPCQNGGECIDHIGSYECHCTKGFSGNRCQTKVDFCANKVCPEGHRCIDRGNEFSCECPGGRNGPDCNQMSRTQCNANPCTHGGTCWTSGDSYYCACRPGYTGAVCEDEFVVETVVSSSEFMVDDLNARNFNDKTYGSSVVLKSPIELHNAYFAAGVLAAAIFIVAVVVTICHCKVNQTYRKFSTRTTAFFPILGFGRRPKPLGKLNKHWLSGKGLAASAHLLRSNGNYTAPRTHLPTPHQQQQQQNIHHNNSNNNNNGSQLGTSIGQLNERPFQRQLAMNLENDMYYTVDFSDNSQHSPLIQ